MDKSALAHGSARGFILGAGMPRGNRYRVGPGIVRFQIASRQQKISARSGVNSPSTAADCRPVAEFTFIEDLNSGPLPISLNAVPKG